MAHQVKSQALTSTTFNHYLLYVGENRHRLKTPRNKVTALQNVQIFLSMIAVASSQNHKMSQNVSLKLTS